LLHKEDLSPNPTKFQVTEALPVIAERPGKIVDPANRENFTHMEQKPQI
jgi:hypothetical protein